MEHRNSEGVPSSLDFRSLSMDSPVGPQSGLPQLRSGKDSEKCHEFRKDFKRKFPADRRPPERRMRVLEFT